MLARDPNELWGAGAGIAGLFALWGGGMLLGRFSAERDSPDPERWLLRHQRAARVTPPGSRCLYCGGNRRLGSFIQLLIQANRAEGPASSPRPWLAWLA